MYQTAREAAIKRLIQLNYNEKTAPHIVDTIIEVFTEFSPKEVISTILVNGKIKLNTAMKQAYFNEEPIKLTPKELRLVEYFMRNTNQVIPNRTILKDCWGPAYIEEDAYLRVAIGDIRKKIFPDFIKTKSGLGYFMELDIS